MKLFDHFRCVRIAPLAILVGFMLLAGTSQTAISQPIVYSWTGTIQPFNAEVDPWGLGDIATPFFISVAVEQAAIDVAGNNFDVNLAAFSGFDLMNAQFRIDGVSAIVGEGNSIIFDDFDSSDFVEIDFDTVHFNGRSAPILSKVRLPGSTFTFVEVFESPPAFSPVQAISGVAPLSESPYWAIVEPGTVVTGSPVPEPATFGLALLALMAVASRLWRKRNR